MGIELQKVVQAPEAVAWIGVDLDGTLAEYPGTHGIRSVGKPIAPMVQRVRNWLAAGQPVRIVTARVAACGARSEEDENFVLSGGLCDDEAFAARQRAMIQAWCVEQFGTALPVTASKDFAMIELWDDRARQVETNTGIVLGRGVGGNPDADPVPISNDDTQLRKGLARVLLAMFHQKAGGVAQGEPYNAYEAGCALLGIDIYGEHTRVLQYVAQTGDDLRR